MQVIHSQVPGNLYWFAKQVCVLGKVRKYVHEYNTYPGKNESEMLVHYQRKLERIEIKSPITSKKMHKHLKGLTKSPKSSWIGNSLMLGPTKVSII